MKKILFAVCGLSPQVITEALYALMQEGRMVDTVQVITTGAGRDRIFSRLLAPAGGVFQKFLDEYGQATGGIDFPPENVHVLCHEDGREIQDILGTEDNDALIRACLEMTARFTASDDSAVFFLVAGGRKTMTSCLTLAAQIYGRPQDRIYHILVSPEFESCRDFWYPPKKSRWLDLKDSNGLTFRMETRQAKIHLISIPFVPVRDLLSVVPGAVELNPAALIRTIVREPPSELVIDLNRGVLGFGRLEMDMHPAKLALYTFFAARKLACDGGRPCDDCSDCFQEGLQVTGSPEVAALYRKIPGARYADAASDTGIAASLSMENFQSYKAKIKSELLRAFGSAGAGDLEIVSVGSKPDTRYGLRLDRRRIRVISN